MINLINEINSKLKAIISELETKKSECEKVLDEVKSKIDKKIDEAKGYKVDVDSAKDKIKTLGLHLNKGKNDFAKIIEESPVNIECKVKEIKELGSHDMFLAEVVCVNVDKKYFDDTNKFDMSKCGLIAYMHGKYYELGNELGKFGFSVKKK